MESIINGLRYNTDKAEVIGSYDNGLSRSDFRRWAATLYVTPKSRRFFLAGEGGPLTSFAKQCSNGSKTVGSAIVPLTKEEALEWAEKYLKTPDVEEFFSDMIDDA